ncbi:TPM domain-containing protein [Nonlabens xiamenensis]|uniref:TPM domain-containing protein n=1 Tax=Nonlabens xiamenensis TaxID=2341043 RepID=UPI000F615ABB|nr:TPM domain-containing protein [Nonlabens xiamenensis]
MYKSLILSLFLLLGAQLAWAQFQIPKKPSVNNQKAVYDYANLFSDTQRKVLSNKLQRYADSTSTQIVYVIINSSNGEELDLLGARWGEQWGIGQEKEDNGIILIMAVQDRKVDINLGRGIEPIISDRDAERMVNRILIPNFKKQAYYQGLDQTADAIFQALNGEFDGSGRQQPFPYITLFAFAFFLFIIFLNIKNRGKGGGTGGGSLLDVIILSNMGRGGYSNSSGGGFSGGGFSGGFGGGSFGGGGAGGSW